jgi:uncharacterized protein YebE (UPF0316 family)
MLYYAAVDIAVGLQLTNLHPAVVPILIFFARIIDVSIGTLRIILVGRGMRFISSLLGFFEVFIWLLAISQIVTNLGSLVNMVAYCAGFAAGTYVGMTIERRLSLGNMIVRVIVPHESAHLIMYLIANNYKVTHVDAEGALGKVKIIFTIVRRSELKHVLEIIRRFDKDAVYTVEDVRMVSESGLPKAASGSRLDIFQPSMWFRKSK